MPLIQSIDVEKNTQVWIWHIQEEEKDLSQIKLEASSAKRLESMKSESHRKGFLAVRHLLHAAGYLDSDLYYESTGKPNLKDGNNISISHSFDYSVIIVSNKIIGIDIEKQREKIKRISRRFIGREKVTFKSLEEEIRILTKIWAIKESLFKTRPEGNILFKEHLEVEPFTLDQNQVKAWIKKDGKIEEHQAYFIDLPNYSLAYTIKQF